MSQTRSGLPPGALHEVLYGDPKRVHAARVQAEGIIGYRNIRRLLVESWAIPVVEWLAARLNALGRDTRP